MSFSCMLSRPMISLIFGKMYCFIFITWVQAILRNPFVIPVNPEWKNTLQILPSTDRYLCWQTHSDGES